MTFANKPIRILLVDDSLTMLWGLGKLVQGEFPRMTLIGTAHTDGEALVYAYLRPDVIVLDLELDSYSTIEIIPALRQRSGGGVLIHTDIGDRRLHDDAMLFGASCVVGKDAAAAVLLDAIERVHASRGFNVALPLATPPGTACIAAAEDAGVRLSVAERRLVIDLIERWQKPAAGAWQAPVVLAQIVSLYDKLDVRNRLELVHFAMAHELAGETC